MTAVGNLLFVYGTLRSGQANAGRWLGGRALAPAVLEGFELRLGAWPWVRPAAASAVVGEVVDLGSAPDGAELLSELDRLEGVGEALYRREWCTVRLGGGEQVGAWTYVGGSVAATGARPVPGGDWLTAFAWYVAYGSNLASTRFRRYLEGCRDTSPPWRWAAVEVPHRMLFARESRHWGGGGVAFLDPAPAPGATTRGRAWLLTWEQFADVLAQECGLPVGSLEVPPLDGVSVVAMADHWYGCVVPLGRLEGWPMVSFTDESAATLVAGGPGAAYRAVVTEGLMETHGLTAAEAEAYITRHSI